MAQHLDRGQAAETQALHFLEQRGLKLITRNYRCRLGEIDLILQDRNVVVFVEVRLRRKTSFGGAAESITYSKQCRLIRAAHCYLLTEGKPHQHQSLRFDAVLLDHYHKIDWIKNAFEVQC